MVVWVAVLPRVDQLTKMMPNFWRAVYFTAFPSSIWWRLWISLYNRNTIGCFPKHTFLVEFILVRIYTYIIVFSVISQKNEMTQVFEILPRGRRWPFYPTQSIACLMLSRVGKYTWPQRYRHNNHNDTFHAGTCSGVKCIVVISVTVSLKLSLN